MNWSFPSITCPKQGRTDKSKERLDKRDCRLLLKMLFVKIVCLIRNKH